MSKRLTHWKQTMNPDYLGAWALQPDEEPILTISKANMEKVIGTDGKKEECLVISYPEKIGPGKMIVNATNSKTIEKLAGSPYIEHWPGTQIQVYTERVKAFGDVVCAIRIRPHKVQKPAPVPKCTVCKGDIKPAYNKTAAALAEYTTEKFRSPMCAACAEKHIASQTSSEEQSE